jgi:hypothetical protein
MPNFSDTSHQEATNNSSPRGVTSPNNVSAGQNANPQESVSNGSIPRASAGDSLHSQRNVARDDPLSTRVGRVNFEGGIAAVNR